MNLKRDTYAIVDLDHLKYNVELAHNEFKRPLMAVIKADAYVLWLNGAQSKNRLI